MLVSELEKNMQVSEGWRKYFSDTNLIEFKSDQSWKLPNGVIGVGFISLFSQYYNVTREEAIFHFSRELDTILEDKSPKEKSSASVIHIKADCQPHPCIEVFTNEILDSTKSPRSNMAIATVLITLSVLLSGSYTSPDSHGALSLFYLAHARAAGGKGSYGTIPRQILNEIDLDLCGDDCGGLCLPQSVQAFLNSFDECNKKYMESPEAGEFFDNLRDKRSSIYDLRPKFRSAWNGEFIQGTRTKLKKDSCPPCPYPVLTLWCAMTATQAKEMMEDRRTAIDGLLSRISFITTSETHINATGKRLFLSNDIMSKLKNLSKRTIEQLTEHRKKEGGAMEENTLKIRVGEHKRIKISDEAWQLAKEIELKCREDVDQLTESLQDVMASLVARLYEKTMRVASLIAAYEFANLKEDDWVINQSHLDWAYKWERSHLDNLKEIAAIASEESIHSKLKASILLAIDSIPPIKRKGGEWVSYSDMRVTNKGSLRAAKPLDIYSAILDLEEAGIIATDRDNQPTKKPRLLKRS